MSRIYEELARFKGPIAVPEDGAQATPVKEPGPSAADSVVIPAGVELAVPKGASGLEGIPVEEVDLKRLRRVPLVRDPRGGAADRFRFLRLRVLEFRNQKPCRRLLVTSPLPKDGKSTIALNLATALADAGKRNILLIDADPHHATVTRQLGLPGRPGLTECLQAGADPMSTVLRLEPLACYFLPAGAPAGNPGELLQSAGLPRVLAALSARFDWTILDSPPVAPFSDVLSLKSEADGTLLVVRAGHTPGDAVEETLKLLGHEHVLGIVLNAVEGLDRLYTKYSKYYGNKA